MSQRKICVEINETLLADVQRVLSTATIKDTIEEAFREVLKAAGSGSTGGHVRSMATLKAGRETRREAAEFE